ncbi:trypsin-1-like [Daphnia pulex]|uniref:trypsin-1-like n=1 Tax=Daphnia pulex TaxID=6669 RepID=UPI001EDE3491|nr:trypsin-1-like [Daphnia pulex]
MKHLLIISVLVAIGAGAPRDLSERIAGGSLATEGEFPYIASVQLEHRHYCSGMIYNDRWILTAAFCVSGFLPSQLQVVVGIVSFISPSAQQQTIAVSSVVTHPQYDNVTKLNDIALISLNRPILFGSAVQEIRYDEVDEAIPTAITMGWGASMEGGVEVTKLRKTVLTLPLDCSSYGATEFNFNYMICAGSDVSSPCHYDEGSPLVQNGIAVGIMSKNKGCTAPYIPSIFTRLSVYYYWINAVGGQQAITTSSTPATTLSTVKPTVPTAPCINCETPTTTIQPTIPTAPCINCETPAPTTTIVTTVPTAPTAPCINCETPTTTTTIKTTITAPTAPCLNCETPTSTTPKPIIPTAPCFNCVP